MKILSPRTHSIIGFIVGIALLIAPNLFAFSDVGGAAVLIPRLLGIVVIVSELSVAGSFSKRGFIPMRIHIITDVILGVLLALSPYLFGFSDEAANAWLPHVIVGVAIIGYALVTRTTNESNTNLNRQ